MYVLSLVLCFVSHANHKNFIGIQTGGRPAGSCTAALFLKPFAEGIEAKNGEEPAMKWAHLDIAGSMEVRALFSTSVILSWWFLFALRLMMSFLFFS
jgi:hypothetical protein